MATKANCIKKPATAEFLKMVCGPKVNIYVGQNREHYEVPKELLCYYSAYFDRCFNGGFREATEQKLELLDDDVADFEMLLEYMLRGDLPSFLGDNLSVSQCMSFIEYADKYEMAEVCEILYAPLKKALLQPGLDSGSPENTSHARRRIEPSDVELVFRVTPAGSRLRTLVAADVVSSQGIKGDKFVQQEEEIMDFAAAVLKQIRKSLGGTYKWVDPMTGNLRIYKER